jgi:hypothetical protein
MKKSIFFAATFILISCGEAGPIESVPCQLAASCLTENNSCITCMSGYVCGLGNRGEVTCIQKDVSGGSFFLHAKDCSQGQIFEYAGSQYNLCFNIRNQSLRSECKTILDNCH